MVIVAEKLSPDTVSDVAGGYWQPHLCGKNSVEELRFGDSGRGWSVELCHKRLAVLQRRSSSLKKSRGWARKRAGVLCRPTVSDIGLLHDGPSPDISSHDTLVVLIEAA